MDGDPGRNTRRIAMVLLALVSATPLVIARDWRNFERDRQAIVAMASAFQVRLAAAQHRAHGPGADRR